jgi:hypothetical protein
MKEGLIKDAYELIIKEIQTIVTISYIIAVAVGMLFNFQKYAEFDINIFEYGDVFDFLIAPFSDVYIILFATVSILIVYLLLIMDSYWKKKWPKSYSITNFKQDKKPGFSMYRAITFALAFIVYLSLAADFYGKYTKEKIILQNEISIRMEDDEIKTGKLIGKTKDIMFLLDGESVYAIPITSLVKEIKLK